MFLRTALFYYLSFIIANVVVQAAPSDEPGVRARVNPTGFEFLREQLRPLATNLLMGFDFPVISGTQGLLQYTISDINLTSFSIDNIILNSQAPDILTLGVDASSININMTIGVSLGGFINVSCDLVSSIKSFDIIQSIIFEVNEANQLSFNLSSCRTSIRRFRFTSKKCGRLLSYVKQIARSFFTPFVENATCGAIKELHSSELSNRIFDITATSFFNLTSDILFDFSLTKKPAISNDSIDACFTGRFFPSSDFELTFSEFSTTGVSGLSVSGKSQMFQIALGQNFFNSFLNTSFLIGRLFYEIPSEQINSMMSSGLPFGFSIEALSLIDLKFSKYTNIEGLQYSLVFKPPNPPRILFREDSASMSGTLNISVKIDFANGTTVVEDFLELDFSADASFQGSGRVLSWNISGVDINFRNPSNNPLINLLNTVGSDVLSGIANNFTIPGFQGYGLDMLTIQQKEHQVEISADLIVAPPDEDY